MADPSFPCPVCHDGVLEPFLRIDSVPVVSTQLWPTRQDALDAPRGDLDLGVCRSCGMIRNLAFKPALVEYDAAYENSQHFSPAFSAYAAELARRLVDTYGLRSKVVAEIGSGKGEFLALLCEEGGNRGFGFDPTYDGQVDDHDAAERITFVRDYYSEAFSHVAADLVCCRHVLEHVDDPGAMLDTVRQAIAGRGTPVYFEVPHAGYVLGPSGLWDFIYQHVSYFSPPTLRLLFERQGFDVADVRSSFDGQFLSIEARPGAAPAGSPQPDPQAVAEVVGQVDALVRRYQATVERWTELVERRSYKGGVVLWGAGAKGVTFLNATGMVAGIDTVVDLNPRKHGSYIPGTGQQIVAPDELRSHPPDTVLVMNPIYRDEISRQLETMDLRPEVVCV